MFDELVAATTGAHGAAAVEVWARVENAACARRIGAMVAMLDAAHAAQGSTDREQWCLDNWGAVCAHVGAAQRLTSGAASGLLMVGTVLRDRLPAVGAVFATGVIGYPLARTIAHRTMLVTDPHALRVLDTRLARALKTWEPMSVDKTEHAIDAVIARIDPHALRRTHTNARSRAVDVTTEDGNGMASLFATLFTPDAKALDTRLDALAGTICPADPRTLDQRRADALGALARGADRLACLCGTENCPAAELPPAAGVVVYVVAHHDTITGPTAPPPAPPPPDQLDGPAPDGPDADSASQPEPYFDAAEGDSPFEAAPAHPVEGAAACAGPGDEMARLDGEPPAMFTKPLCELTLTEALTPEPGYLPTTRPAAIMGGQFLPGAIARRAAMGATLVPIVHPGLAPPEPRYRPSTRLADFVRCRDQTCRFPGCHEPATNCDLDHTIVWPHGPTAAANLKALCRRHHLLKTFWGGQRGWREQQLVDGTIIWTAPDGRTHTTTPGSRQLFPELSEPTAPITALPPSPHGQASGLTMPRRRKTRAQDRAERIAYERALNQVAMEHEATPGVREPMFKTAHSHPGLGRDSDPPPF